MTINLGQLHKVEQHVHVTVRVATAVVQLLPLAHHTQITIVERQHLDQRIVLQTNQELLNAHLNRTFADHAEHVNIELDQLNAHNIEQTHAHRTQTTEVDPTAQLFELTELRNEHLVLTHVEHDVMIGTTHQLDQLLDHELELDDLIEQLVLQTIALLPLVDLVPPGHENTLIKTLQRFLDLDDQLLQHVLHVAHDGDVDLDALGDARWIDVDVDNLTLDLCEMLEIADHTIVETNAHGDHHVDVLHGHVDFVRTMHTQHAQKVRIRNQDRTQAHQRADGKIVQQRAQLAQFLGNFNQDHTTADVDVRALDTQQQLHDLADLPTMALAHQIVRAHFHGLGIMENHGLEKHILQNVDHHGTGTTDAHDVENLLQDDDQLDHVLNKEIVLDDRARDADDIALLKNIKTDHEHKHLTDDDHHRDRVHVDRDDADDDIDDTRTEDDQDHTDVTDGTYVAVNNVHDDLFVTHQHVLDDVLLVKNVVDVQDDTTRVTPHVLDVFDLQTSHKNVGTIEDFDHTTMRITLEHVHDESTFRIFSNEKRSIPLFTTRL